MDGGNENARARTSTGARGRHARFDDLIRRSLDGVAGGLLGALAFLFTWIVEQRARTLRELLTQGLMEKLVL
jgi:hypothetical protein